MNQMKKIKRYRKGKRIYTNWGKLTKQVTVFSKREPVEKMSSADISIDPGTVEEKTSNLARISHNKEEFVIDFFQRQGNRAKLSSRIITAPPHVKRLYRALSENMKIYEKRIKR
jgi:hypothetical protein